MLQKKNHIFSNYIIIISIFVIVTFIIIVFGIMIPFLSLTNTSSMQNNLGNSFQNVKNNWFTINIKNMRNKIIFVNFTVPNAIQWRDNNCNILKSGISIQPGKTCVGTMIQNVIQNNYQMDGLSSRFCGSEEKVYDCWNAQQKSLTMIETTFVLKGKKWRCFPEGSDCVWYDISVIPQNCINELFYQNQCANTGDASYNLPVLLGCNNIPTYICKGPKSAINPSRYPIFCGTADGNCTGMERNNNFNLCNQAYFFPAPKIQPNTVCSSDKIFNIVFLSGA